MGNKRPPELLGRKKRSALQIAGTVLCAVLIVVLLSICAFNLWLGQNYYVVNVDGTSMNATLHDGDVVYAQKKFTANRGDVVVVDVRDFKGSGVFREGTDLLIKRLIAVEGDCVKCESGVLYLKKGEGEYEALSERYVSGVTEDFEEIAVGEGEIFFLGDNRLVSNDSLNPLVGCLRYEKIVGVVPEWAIRIKGFTKTWEGFRLSLVGRSE